MVAIRMKTVAQRAPEVACSGLQDFRNPVNVNILYTAISYRTQPLCDGTMIVAKQLHRHLRLQGAVSKDAEGRTGGKKSHNISILAGVVPIR
jgi:hypothetical protein